MGNKQSQLITDFENCKLIAERQPQAVAFDTQNDADTYASLIRERQTVVEIIPRDGKFAITKHLLPPLWLGVYTIPNATIMRWVKAWASQNDYSTSVKGDVIAVGSSAYSFRLSPGIPVWYSDRRIIV